MNIAGKNVRPMWRHIQHYYKCYAMWYVNILYNDIIILHITLIEKLWNVDPPLFSAWSTYEPISSLEMLTIVNTLLLTYILDEVDFTPSLYNVYLMSFGFPMTLRFNVWLCPSIISKSCVVFILNSGLTVSKIFKTNDALKQKKR